MKVPWSALREKRTHSLLGLFEATVVYQSRVPFSPDFSSPLFDSFSLLLDYNLADDAEHLLLKLTHRARSRPSTSPSSLTAPQLDHFLDTYLAEIAPTRPQHSLARLSAILNSTPAVFSTEATDKARGRLEELAAKAAG
eukprot:CAMPEP_0174886106 /NCGR_PEP_ID=MMETSP0167-20121228/1385_1 /TAXON_ID=38298 /ORGANISM="Rhodella maculata, Strain CCMP736" /LENGTH=138 /DNA_ID=CAMNT_0016121969 /DNA_START=144 /DNA_END=556 /DNA_ORIENTATION=-